MRKLLIALPILAAVSIAAAAPAPADLNGREIQFSYSPSWKFTPLLMGFGETTPGKANTYTLRGETRTCEVRYTPQATADKAHLTIEGKRDKATIQLTFRTEESGTAHMKWNGADYYGLSFRVQSSDAPHHYLQRMGDPVGDVIPTSLAGKVLEIDFRGAFTCRRDSTTQQTSYQASKAAPLVVQFPASDSNFTSQGQDGPPLSVQYELRSCGAVVSMSGGQEHNTEISLDFADSESGLAHVSRTEGDNQWEERAARFRLRPAESNTGYVSLPQMRGAEPLLADLIRGLENITYPTAVERLYQKRLLILLPQIAAGASTETVLPNANNSTALHYACGLSHVELVQWLIDHGANLHAKTAKGAGVEDCVGGKNAKTIRLILHNAKSAK